MFDTTQFEPVFAVLTSKKYPLKWRICYLDCDNHRFDDMDEVSPAEVVEEILIGLPVEIYLCNDERGKEPMIGLVFDSKVYTEYGLGGEENTGDPVEDALVNLQKLVEPMKHASLAQQEIRNAWLKVFQAALDANEEPGASLVEHFPFHEDWQTEVGLGLGAY
jgi:hypothetical protein